MGSKSFALVVGGISVACSDSWALLSCRIKRFHPFDADIYKRRNLIERMFCRLKDWRRITTRYDKLAANFAAAVAIATIVLWWT